MMQIVIRVTWNQPVCQNFSTTGSTGGSRRMRAGVAFQIPDKYGPITCAGVQ